MKDYRKLFGSKNERIGCEYLTSKGYIVLNNNKRFKRAEIDIIAIDKKNSTLCLIEVKSRTRDTFTDFHPASRKQLLRIKRHGDFLQRTHFPNLYARVDLLTIVITDNIPTIKHYINVI